MLDSFKKEEFSLRQERMFFFEKKNQKTFIGFYTGYLNVPGRKTNKSFWGAFFQKGAFLKSLIVPNPR
jgi:hypothetical protein